MGTFNYASGDIPCYSQLGVTGGFKNAAATTGSGLMNLLGFQDYVLARPPSSSAATLQERIGAFRGAGADLTVTPEFLEKDAAELGLRCTALAPDRVVDGGPSLVLVEAWPELVPIGAPDHWIAIRRTDETHAEVNDPCWQGLGADWAARRWVPADPPRDQSIFGAVRRIPLRKLAPLLRAGAVFRLAPGA